MTEYQPLDAVRHVAAAAFLAWAKAADLQAGKPELSHEHLVASLVNLLTAVKNVAAEHVGVLCDDPDHYSDGRAVCGLTPLVGDADFCWLWHPAPSNELNQPHTIAEDFPAGGRLWRVFVSAPGVVDAVPLDG